MAKLDTNQLHLLQLAARDSDAEGWMPVSKMLWPVIQFLPDDLVEKRAAEAGGHIRLTAAGDAVLRYAS